MCVTTVRRHYIYARESESRSKTTPYMDGQSGKRKGQFLQNQNKIERGQLFKIKVSDAVHRAEYEIQTRLERAFCRQRDHLRARIHWETVRHWFCGAWRKDERGREMKIHEKRICYEEKISAHPFFGCAENQYFGRLRFTTAYYYLTYTYRAVRRAAVLPPVYG